MRRVAPLPLGNARVNCTILPRLAAPTPRCRPPFRRSISTNTPAVAWVLRVNIPAPADASNLKGPIQRLAGVFTSAERAFEMTGNAVTTVGIHNYATGDEPSAPSWREEDSAFVAAAGGGVGWHFTLRLEPIRLDDDKALLAALEEAADDSARNLLAHPK